MSTVVSRGHARRAASHSSTSGYSCEIRPTQPAAPSCPLRLHSRSAAVHAPVTPPSWEELLGQR